MTTAASPYLRHRFPPEIIAQCVLLYVLFPLSFRAVEKANDRIVARRQKRRGMQWGAETSDALAAVRTLLLNGGWDAYWQERCFLPFLAA